MLESTAPEAQSTKRSQQVNLLLARRAWSAASTCQASWACSGRGGRACSRSGKGEPGGAPARTRWTVRTEGSSSNPRRGSQQRRKGAPQPGFSARRSRMACLKGAATAVAGPQPE
jgi:hypothetical protein